MIGNLTSKALFAFTLAVLALVLSAGRSWAQVPLSGTIDLVQYWPNPAMQRTHYLHGTAGDFPIRDVHGDNSFMAFQLYQEGGGAVDTYVIFPETIALIASVTVDETGRQTVWTYDAAQYPHFKRFLDLALVPTTLPWANSRVHRTTGLVSRTDDMPGSRIYVTRTPDGIRLQWGSLEVDGGYEAMTIGDVPIEDQPGATAPGLIRYEAPHWNIDTRFSWAPR